MSTFNTRKDRDRNGKAKPHNAFRDPNTYR